MRRSSGPELRIVTRRSGVIIASLGVPFVAISIAPRSSENSIGGETVASRLAVSFNAELWHTRTVPPRLSLIGADCPFVVTLEEPLSTA
jgi:hypothetical protein